MGGEEVYISISPILAEKSIVLSTVKSKSCPSIFYIEESNSMSGE